MVYDAEWCEEDHPDWDGEDRNSFYRKRKSVIGVPERQFKTWNGVSVKSMESDHIMNSILYCERKFSEAITHHENCFPNNTRDNFYFLTVYDMFPEYVNLRNEWDKRMEKK